MGTLLKHGVVGFDIDLCKGEFSVPHTKLYSLKLQLHAVAEAQSVPARQLCSQCHW